MVDIDGVSGTLMYQIRDRVPALLAANPGVKYLWLLGGVNSIQAQESVATITGEYQDVYDLCRTAGVTVIHGTTLPCAQLLDHTGTGGTSTAQKQAILEQCNRWIMNSGRVQSNVIVIPWHIPLTNPSDGLPRTNTMQDGTHPTTYGAQIMGAYAADILAPLIPDTGDRMTASQTDGSNGITAAALMLGTGGKKNSIADPTVPDGWNVLESGTHTVVPSTVARADGIGNWLQLAVTGAGTDGSIIAQHETISLPTANGVIVGDTDVYAICDFECDDDWVNARRLEFQIQTPGTVYKMVAYAAANTADVFQPPGLRGVLKTPRFRTPPVAYSDRKLQIRILVTANTGQVATIRFGRVTLIPATAPEVI